MAEEYDVVVVGAGAVGSAAAYHAAKTGRRTLLLEQFALGHDRGSSHGESRIIRHSYSSLDYATLAPAAFEMWRALERESGADLLRMTGGMDLGEADEPALTACRDALAEAGFGHLWLEGGHARAYARQFNLPDGWAVLYQSGAGILHAGRCVRTLAAQAIAHGATMLEHACVVTIEPGVRNSTVTFDPGGSRESVSARAVIVAAGPWAGRFLHALGIERPLSVTHQQVAYYPVVDEALWSATRAPVYIAHGRDGFYGFPVCERPGYIKVGIELEQPIDDPDVPQREPGAAALAVLNETIARRFRGIQPEPADVVTCRYTETADRDFIIDRHPSHPGIVVASPCSGHGFKFAMVSGKLALDLATTRAGSYDSPLWRPRFALQRNAVPDNPLAREWRAASEKNRDV